MKTEKVDINKYLEASKKYSSKREERKKKILGNKSARDRFLRL